MEAELMVKVRARQGFARDPVPEMATLCTTIVIASGYLGIVLLLAQGAVSY